MNFPVFPKDFLFGAATAAFQVEGAAGEDGRAPSIWDTFTRLPGRIVNDTTADVTSDQYHHYKEDVQLMKSIGLDAYRFSISWPRVLPAGRGRVNEKGFDYYERLVDELLANGIQPWVTLYHWDLPQALEDEYGGWRDRRVADDLADYAALVADRLSDRVRNFFTINEFYCFIDKGYGLGNVFDSFAPGLNIPRKELNQARHNALLAHGKAAQALRAHARQPLNIGLADNPNVCVPMIETEREVAAARKAFGAENAWLLTAVMEGAYRDTYLASEGANSPEFSDEDMKVISTPLDFVGLNMYAPCLVRHVDTEKGYEFVPFSASHPKMHMPWLNFGPEVAYWGPRFTKELWDVKAVYITENGCAADDVVTIGGEVLDTDRVAYLRQYTGQAARAAAEGFPLKGYFLWSLLDNFEWAYGLSRRFGIIYVNYSTLERIPKLSASWYRELIAQPR